MMDLESLRGFARQSIEEGRLPARKARRTFGGTGSNALCALCGEYIPPHLMEIEIESDPDAAPITLHVGCHAAWLAAVEG